MSRLKTTATLPKVTPQQRKKIITETRSYRLITPLYGGGVEPEKADPITVIRATEIRGHLRFWWRATRGGAYKNLAEMRQYEEAIFGSAAGDGKAGQSKVHVFVSEAYATQKISKIKTRNGENVHISDPKSPYSYVAFPLRGDDNKPEGDLLKEGVTFSIAFSYPQEAEMPEGKKSNIAQELEAALWAWETFGGIGARTRRGFGALCLEKINGHSTSKYTRQELISTVKKRLGSMNDFRKDEIPFLSSDLSKIVFLNEDNVDDAWRVLVKKLKNFRQYRRKGTSGPSYWPEPDAVRHITGRYKKRSALSQSTYKEFPRAQFGLPIIFHFKDKDDPFETTLQGEKYERLASPLILRPVACSDGAVGIALILDVPKFDDLRLVNDKKYLNEKVISTISPQQSKKIPILNGETDILKAFLDTL